MYVHVCVCQSVLYVMRVYLAFSVLLGKLAFSSRISCGIGAEWNLPERKLKPKIKSGLSAAMSTSGVKDYACKQLNKCAKI